MATFIPNVTDVFPEPSLFTPDFSFMDKMLSRRQSMYDQGWSQVNSAYNFVNKELTNPENVKNRDIFLKQAKDNLKNLSSMDLSQHQNVMSANSVFEPWVNNRKALGDSALTSHWKQQEQQGEGYRLDDGGKFFNQTNIDYIRKQRMAFANDAADTWEGYYQNKRSYTPYYDYHKEVTDLMKDFKPSTYKIDRVRGLYKYTDENASWTQAEIRKYLDANLSDKAKQQMKIEGDVAFNNDPKVLGQTFIGMAKNEMESYDAGIQLANKQLKIANKPEEIVKIKEYISNLEDKKKSLNTNIESINKGDYTYIKKNGENLAMNIYYGQYMKKVSNGWSHADVTNKIDADDVALSIYKENRADSRQDKALRHSEYLARLKGEIAPPPQMNTLSTKETEAVNLKSIQTKVEGLQTTNDQIEQTNKGMVATWMQTLPENKGKTISTKEVGTEEMKRFMNEGMNGKPLPDNHPFRANQDQMWKNDSEINIRNRKIDEVRADIERNYSPEQKKALLDFKANVEKLGSVTTADGTKISATEILNTIQKNPNAVEIISPFYNPVDGTTSGLSGTTIKIGNKKYSAYTDETNNTSYNLDLEKMIQKVTNLGNNSKSFKTNTNDVNAWFEKNGKTLANTLNLMTFAKGSYEAKTMETEMHNIFPEAQYDIQSAGIGSDARSQGNAYFYITPKSGFDASSDDIKTYLTQRGYGVDNVNAIKQEGTGTTVFEIKNYKSPITSQYANFNQLERAVIQDLSTSQYVSDGGSYTSAPYKSYSNRPLQVKKDHGSYYLLMQGLENSNTMDIFPWTFNDAASAVLKGQQLTATIGSVPEAMLQEYIRVTNQ